MLSAVAILSITILTVALGRRVRDSLLNVSEVTWLPEAGAYTDHNSRFVGSPSLVKVGNRWLASHDYFFHTPVGTVSVFQSTDESGVEWEFRANLTGIYWAQLFAPDGPNGDAYLIGPEGDETGKGNLRISRCAAPCDGSGWEEPSTLIAGTAERMFHAAPTPVVHHGPTGQLLRSMEVHGTAVPEGDLGIVMLAASAGCRPLTTPGCWAVSDPILWNSTWLQPAATAAGLHHHQVWSEAVRGTLGSAAETRQWEEANAIVDPETNNASVLVRLDAPLHGCTTIDGCNRAALLSWTPSAAAITSTSDSTATTALPQGQQLSPDAGSLQFKKIVSMPTGCNKFIVRADIGAAQSGNGTWFYALSNPVDKDGIAAGTCGQRNRAVLSRSRDLENWIVCEQVLFDDTGYSPSDSVAHTGLQYIDFRFDGADIVMAIRAGYRGSVTYHDANRLLVKRLSNYEALCA